MAANRLGLRPSRRRPNRLSARLALESLEDRTTPASLLPVPLSVPGVALTDVPVVGRLLETTPPSTLPPAGETPGASLGGVDQLPPILGQPTEPAPGQPSLPGAPTGQVPQPTPAPTPAPTPTPGTPPLSPPATNPTSNLSPAAPLALAPESGPSIGSFQSLYLPPPQDTRDGPADQSLARPEERSDVNLTPVTGRAAQQTLRSLAALNGGGDGVVEEGAPAGEEMGPAAPERGEALPPRDPEVGPPAPPAEPAPDDVEAAVDAESVEPTDLVFAEMEGATPEENSYRAGLWLACLPLASLAFEMAGRGHGKGDRPGRGRKRARFSVPAGR